MALSLAATPLRLPTTITARTRRLLLLLESRTVRRDDAYRRVIRNGAEWSVVPQGELVGA